MAMLGLRVIEITYIIFNDHWIISDTHHDAGISSAAKFAELEQRDRRAPTGTPDIEWWDSLILPDEVYPDEGEPVRVKEDFISSLVEHPAQMAPEVETKPAELQVWNMPEMYLQNSG